MAQRAALCGKKEIIIVDLAARTYIIPFPSPSSEDVKNRDPNHNYGGDVIVAAISPSGRYCVAADDSKRVLIFDLDDCNAPRLLTQFAIPRRPSCCAFSFSEDAVLVADKSGDVFRASLQPPFSSEASLLLGHLSIVTDVQMCPSGLLVATADRDEKIRLSRYPNSYNIAAFLLGHRSFVCRLAFSPCGKFLCSVGGEGHVRLWCCDSGKCLHVLDLKSHENHDESAVPNGLCWLNNHLLLTLEGCRRAFVIYVDPVGHTLHATGQIECKGGVRELLRAGDRFLMLTESDEERLVLVKASEDGMERSEANPVLTQANSELKERLTAAAELCTSLKDLRKAPVDKTGLEAYNERKQQIQKNVQERRTRHQHLKSKRQRQETRSSQSIAASSAE